MRLGGWQEAFDLPKNPEAEALSPATLIPEPLSKQTSCLTSGETALSNQTSAGDGNDATSSNLAVQVI